MLTDAELADARALASITYTAAITATDPTGDDWDPIDGPSDPGDGAALYAGPARVQAVRNTAQPREAAGQQVTVRPYKIALPWDAPDLPIDTRITVDAHRADTAVVGKVLTVTGGVYGDLAVERVLYADLDLTNQPD